LKERGLFGAVYLRADERGEERRGGKRRLRRRSGYRVKGYFVGTD
jgi:hypothetical protein